MSLTAIQIHHRLFAQVRTPRSTAYRLGSLDALRHHLGENKHPCPYTAGTADFDAYWAGWLEGRKAADQAATTELAA